LMTSTLELRLQLTEAAAAPPPRPTPKPIIYPSLRVFNSIAKQQNVTRPTCT